MADLSGLGALTALVAGTVSFLSPCVLPLVPGYVSYVGGQAIAGGTVQHAAARFPPLVLSLSFVLGFSTVFMALGASASAIGQLVSSYRYEANLVGGALIIMFGLFMTGVLKLPWMQRDVRFHGAIAGGRPGGAYLMGLAFAFGWTPCIGPVLGAILAASAVSTTASTGVTLLAFYSLGLGVPFLLAAVFAARILKPLARMRRTGRALQAGAGVIMVLMGLAMITGQLTVFSLWLLRTFPGLATLG